jgi:hypothetical protein
MRAVMGAGWWKVCSGWRAPVSLRMACPADQELPVLLALTVTHQEALTLLEPSESAVLDLHKREPDVEARERAGVGVGPQLVESVDKLL